MIRIIVRAKKDADAIKAMLNLFYPNWNVVVKTLKGARGSIGINKLREIIDVENYNIVLVGKQDSNFLKLNGILGSNTVIHLVPREKIRNSRLSQLAYEFEKAKARFRLEISWSNGEYIFGITPYGYKLPIEINPAYDVFLETKDVVKKYLDIETNTTTLILAIKALGKKRVKAVYIDTGVDFPENRGYVEKIAKKLGVNLIIEEAGVVKELARGKPFPTNDDRWCTKLKIAALYRAISKIGSKEEIAIIVGDRDGESELRSKRPPLRIHEGFTQIAPIKLWSAAHTQLYLLWNNIPLNPLYELGCYICPALRSWEIMIMQTSPLSEILKDKPFYKEFITRFREIGNNRE